MGAFTEADAAFMREAIALARQGWGRTHPNPVVGAVVAQEGEVLGRGFHAKVGAPHAEVAALCGLEGKLSPQAVLYVTLEPCSTQGRTPPCTEAIRKAGVKRVLVGALDPNPQHAGRGLELLRQEGIHVESGVLEADCRDLNLIFNHIITCETPFIAGKLAVTLDGRTAARSGDSKWISGTAARRDVMRWRRYFPAIGVGAETVLMDNSRLSSRLEEEWCPWRFVFDRSLKTVKEPLPKLFSDTWREKTIVVTVAGADSDRKKMLAEANISLWEIESDDEPRAFFEAFRCRCWKKDIGGVLIEGGSQLLSACLACRQLDYLFSYRAPKILADAFSVPMFEGMETRNLEEGIRLRDVRHTIFGEDVLTRGFPVYPN